MDLELVEKVKNQYLSYIDTERNGDINFMDEEFCDIIDGIVKDSYGGDYKKIVESIGTYKVLKEVNMSNWTILRNALECSYDEQYFYFWILTEYVFIEHYQDINLFVKTEYKKWARLHYNRYLEQSNLPNDICAMIRRRL